MKIHYRQYAGSYHLLKYCTLDLHCHADQNSLSKSRRLDFQRSIPRNALKSLCGIWYRASCHVSSSNTQALSGKCIFKPLKKIIKWWLGFPEMKSGTDIYCALKRKKIKKKKEKDEKKKYPRYTGFRKERKQEGNCTYPKKISAICM